MFGLTDSSSITLNIPSGTHYYVIEERNKTRSGKPAYYKTKFEVNGNGSMISAVISTTAPQTFSGT